MKTKITSTCVLTFLLFIVSLLKLHAENIQTDSIFILDENITTSLCSGELYDSGGPDGNYDKFESYTFTIELDEPSCLEFLLLNFDLKANGTKLKIYDSPDTLSTPIATLGGWGFQDFSTGVLQYFYVSSGALTIKFSSGSQVSSGFHALWECYALPCNSNTLETNALASITEIEQMLSGPGTLVKVDTIICADVAFGTFQGGNNSNVGISKGVVLTTGRVENELNGAFGVSNPSNVFASTDNDFPGDADIGIISGNIPANLDACVMILDVFTSGEQLSMEYVMGSEEYSSFVGSSFNDAMAILISGPGIVGAPNLNNQLNIATLPEPANAGIPISINTVNQQDNAGFYKDNRFNSNIVYNGLTCDYQGIKASLTASAPVIPCNHYKVKLVISDFSDPSYDSGMFVSEIRSGTATELFTNAHLEFLSPDGIDYLSTSCSSDTSQVLIQLSWPLTYDVTFDVILTGTAVKNEDYSTNLPASITIPAGETEMLYNLEALPVAPFQDTKTIEISLQQDFGCGVFVMDSLTIELHHAMNVSITGALGDSVLLCEGTSLSLQASGATIYFWEPAGLFINPDSAAVELSPDSSQWIVLNGLTALCNETDSIFVEVVTPEVDLISDEAPTICDGQSLELMAVNNFNDLNISWYENGSLMPDESSNFLYVTPDSTTTYAVSVGPEECTVTDEIQVHVDYWAFPNLPFLDTTICINSSVFLGAPVSGSGSATTVFHWSPATGLSCTDCPNPISTLNEPVSYTLTGNSENNYCSDTATVSVNVENYPCGEMSPWGHPLGSLYAGILLGQIQLDGNIVEDDDWIAAFDEEGNLAGVNKVVLVDSTAYLSLLIYGDDPITPVDEGINDFENFTLTLYRSSSDQFFTFLYPGLEIQFADWMDTGGIPIPAYNSLQDVYNFMSVKVDTIPLYSGWNLISTDVIPLDSSIQSITQGVAPGNLTYITGFNQNGANFYDPNGPPFLNTLHSFERGFGYQVKANQADTLFVIGFPLDSTYFKSMQEGWNLVAYLPQHSQSPAEYFDHFIQENNLLYVTGSTEAGTTYFTPNGLPFLNSLHQLHNSKGYWLKLLEGDNLTNSPEELRARSIPYPNRYQFIGGSASLPLGAEIDVIDQNDQILTTIEVLDNGLLRPGPVYLCPTNGPDAGNTLRFRYHNKLAYQSVKIQGDYNPISVHLSFPSQNAITSPTLITVAPNPFYQFITATYQVPEAAFYLLELRDSYGNLVAVVDQGNKEPGEQIVRWNAGSQVQGVYWLTLYANGTVVGTSKILKID